MAQEIKINMKEQALQILDRLDEMRKDETRFDFKIKVQGETILAQQDILIAGSDYFKAMLSHDTKENQRGEVEMKDIDYECVKICIDFIYARKISVLPEKYENLMFVAQMMELKKLCEGIEELMIKNMNQKTFFVLKKVADSYEYPLLSEKCDEFAEENFESISNEESFNDIDKRYLMSLIESGRTKISEKGKLEVLLKWMKHDPSRKSDTIDLLNGVDLEQVPIGYRRYLIEKEPLITQDLESFRKLSFSVINFAKLPMMDSIKLSKTILLFDHNHNNLRLFNPRTNEVTETKIPKYDDRGYHSVIKLEDHIYVLGRNKSVHRLKYSDDTSTWERMADMIDEHGQVPPAAVYSGEIYVIGGCGGAYTSSVEKYDPRNNKWKKLRDKPRKSNGAAVVELKRFIYCLGGVVNDEVTKDVNKLDVVNSRWIPVVAMNVERMFHSATGIEGGIIAAGGIIVAGGWNKKSLNTVEQYDVTTNQWTMLPNMTINRACFQILLIESQIFAVGGRNLDDDDEDERSLSTIEKYDPTKRVWMMIKLPENIDLMIYDSISLVVKN